MKSIFASAALLLATGAVYAQSDVGQSTLTREQVKAEVIRARAAGELDFNEGNYPPQQPFVSTKTREQVKAEVLAARAAGELDFNEGNYPPQQPFVSTRTREEVKAEVLAARANGELDFNEATYGGFFDYRPANRVPVGLTATAKAKAVQTTQ